MHLHIQGHEGPTAGEAEVEVVERKGLGHPDTICDGIAEQVCRRLCQAYVEQFGHVLHHNVDKILLCAGTNRVAFGGGEILEPIEIFLGGRATVEADGRVIPIDAIAIDACKEHLRETLPLLDVERHVRIVSRLRRGSADLQRLFARSPEGPLANDTSCGAG